MRVCLVSLASKVTPPFKKMLLSASSRPSFAFTQSSEGGSDAGTTTATNPTTTFKPKPKKHGPTRKNESLAEFCLRVKSKSAQQPRLSDITHSKEIMHNLTRAKTEGFIGLNLALSQCYLNHVKFFRSVFHQSEANAILADISSAAATAASDPLNFNRFIETLILSSLVNSQPTPDESAVKRMKKLLFLVE